ncbi:hypothetical protein BN1723_010394, partial [Verticillium longisporum]
ASGELEASEWSDQPPHPQIAYEDQPFDEAELLKLVDVMKLSTNLSENLERAIVPDSAVPRAAPHEMPNGRCPTSRIYVDADEDKSCDAKWGIDLTNNVRIFASTGSVCSGAFRRITCACCWTLFPIEDNDVPRMDGIWCKKLEICKQNSNRWSKWGKLVPTTSCVGATTLTENSFATKSKIKEYCTPKRWFPSAGKGKNTKFHAWSYNRSTGQYTSLKWMYLKLNGQYVKAQQGISDWGFDYRIDSGSAIEFCGFPSDR